MKKTEPCEIDMTPMIDVVFQLIIFFIVTMTIDAKKNEDIRLNMAPDGPVIGSDQDPRTTTIEVDRRGWITMNGAPVSKSVLRKMLRNKYGKHGLFPIMIRGDGRTKHEHIKDVMDLCTESGLWKINFMAINEKKN